MSESAAIHRDMFRAMIGKKLGYGMSRAVYECVLNPEWVIKVEEDEGHFQNIKEWLIWTEAKDRPAGKFLAPVHFMSPSGTILIQSRTKLAREKEYPKEMPKFLTDFKRSNYGLLGKRLVCHDYGTSLVLDHGLATRMRKADWWE